jgi:predicted metal-dependent peptidase
MTPRQKLGKARVRTFDYVPYLASYIYQLREQETPGVGTAAVDKAGNLYWDPTFVTQCNLDQLAYTIVHESLHLVFAHARRAKEVMGNAASEHARYVWNVACDLVVEQTLACMRQHSPPSIIALGVTVPRLGDMVLDFPPNQSADVYYRLINERLRDQEQKKAPPAPPPPATPDDDDDEQDEQPGDDSEDDDDDDEQGDSEPDADADDGDQPDSEPEDDGDGADSDEQGDADAGSGNDGEPGDADGDGSGDTQADGEGSGDGDGSGEAEGPCSPGSGGSAADGFDRDYELEDDGNWENIAADTAAASTEQAIRDYEQQHGIGSVPGTLKESIATRLHPQPDPFAQLRAAVCSSVASPVGGRDLSYRRQSRRQGPAPTDPLLHGRIVVAPNAVVIVDTSASMGYRETKERCLSVISQGLQKLRSVRVICADPQLQSNAMVGSLARFEWTGGGGTSMDAALEEVDRTLRPDCIVLVTDAETGWPARQTRARVVVAAVCRQSSHWYKSIPAWCKKVCMIPEGGAK